MYKTFGEEITTNKVIVLDPCRKPSYLKTTEQQRVRSAEICYFCKHIEKTKTFSDV